LAWTISYTDTARKQLRKLDRAVAKGLLDFIDERIAPEEDPRRIGHALTGPLLGSFWRYRMGDFRIVCGIQDAVLCILVIEIGSCKDVYR
jgi:mRNA interferase RelE/StbE